MSEELDYSIPDQPWPDFAYLKLPLGEIDAMTRLRAEAALQVLLDRFDPKWDYDVALSLDAGNLIENYAWQQYAEDRVHAHVRSLADQLELDV